MNLQAIRNNLEQAKGKKIQIEQSIQKLEKEVKLAGRDLRQHEKAREIIKVVGLQTQQHLQFHISDITSMALEAVFNDPYKLVTEFVERRNKTECDLFFERDGNKVDPLTASGGGTVDVAAFALRIASWSMEFPHSNNAIILDEPMRFVSVDKQEQASLMIKEISKKLGIQFIIITHEPTLAAHADKIFYSHIKKGISKIT